MTGEVHAAKGQQAGQSQPAPFLRKTYELVDDSTTNNIISWGPQGKSFVVWKPSEFAANLLPLYFKHNNFSSFVRQLNTYGFRKVDPDRWEFANEHFQQHNKDLLLTIHRRKPASSHAAAAGGSGGATGHGAAPSGMPSSQQSQQAPTPALSQPFPPAPVPDVTPSALNISAVPAPTASVPIPIPAALHSHGSASLGSGSLPAGGPPFSLSPPFPLDLGIAATLPLFTAPVAAPSPGSGPGSAFTAQQSSLPPLQLPVGILPPGVLQPVAPSSGSAFSRPLPAGPSPSAIKTELPPLAATRPTGPLQPQAPAPALNRLEQLVEDYLKPGQQMLAALTQQGPLPSPSLNAAEGGSWDVGDRANSTSGGNGNGNGNGAGSGSATQGGSGGDQPQLAGGQPHPRSSNSHSSNNVPSASSSELDDPMAADADFGGGLAPGDGGGGGSKGGAVKANKRSRSNLYCSDPSGHGAAAAAVPAAALQMQAVANVSVVASSPAGGGGGGASILTNFDAAGNPLPAGITRPLPQQLRGTTAALLSEMAGQLGRLTALAREVEGLKEENSALRRTMEVLTQAYGSSRLQGGAGGGGDIVEAGTGAAPGTAAAPAPAAAVSGGAAQDPAEGAVVEAQAPSEDAMAANGTASGGSERTAGCSGGGAGQQEGATAPKAAQGQALGGVGGDPSAGAVIVGPGPGLLPLSHVVEVQGRRLWDQKLRHDDLEKQLAAQKELTAMQAVKTAALEAALAANTAKAVHDTAMLGRVIEQRVSAQSEVVQGRLAAQERANKAAQDVNLRLEARVAELEALLRALGQDVGSGQGTAAGSSPPATPLNPSINNNNINNVVNCQQPPSNAAALGSRALPQAPGHPEEAQHQTQPQRQEPYQQEQQQQALLAEAATGADIKHGVDAAPAALACSPPGAGGFPLGGPSQQLPDSVPVKLMLTPEAELYAKSIEDRLWGTVEQIVSSAQSPADGARLVLQIAKARHDAYIVAAAAAAAAAGAPSTSSGGTRTTSTSGGSGDDRTNSEADGGNSGGSGAGDSNTPGVSGNNASGAGVGGVDAGLVDGCGGARSAAVAVAATVSASPITSLKHPHPHLHPQPVLSGLPGGEVGGSLTVAAGEPARQDAAPMARDGSGGGGNVRHHAKHGEGQKDAGQQQQQRVQVGEGDPCTEGSGSCPPPPMADVIAGTGTQGWKHWAADGRYQGEGWRPPHPPHYSTVQQHFGAAEEGATAAAAPAAAETAARPPGGGEAAYSGVFAPAWSDEGCPRQGADDMDVSL